MLSKKNLFEKQRKLTSNPNRFGLRKMKIGVCSVVLGLSFFAIGAHADQVEAEVVTPAEHTELVAGKQEQGSTQQPQNATEDKAAAKQDQDVAQKAQQTGAAESAAKQEAAEDAAAKTAGNNAAATDSKAADKQETKADTKDQAAKPAADQKETAKDEKDTQELAVKKDEKSAKKDDKSEAKDEKAEDAKDKLAKSLAESKVQKTAAEYPVNVNDWTWTNRADGIELNGYTGEIQNDTIVVPNTYDFTQAGKISDGQKVYLNAGFPRKFNDNGDKNGTKAANFAISKNGNGKVYADGNWADAFRWLAYKNIDVTNLDVSQVDRMTYMFSSNGNLERIIGLNTWDTSKVGTVKQWWGGYGDMGGMFAWCTNLKDVGDLSNWDTSHNQNFNQMFFADGALKEIKGVENWDTSSATNMSEMFTGCAGLTSLDLSKWNVSNVDNMRVMFLNCLSLEKVGDLSGWNVSKVKDTSDMFNSTKIKDLNVSGWDLRNDTNVSKMFLINNNSVIRMNGLKLDKTKTNFNLQSFNDPTHNLVVFTDDADLQNLLNGQKRNNQKISIQKNAETPVYVDVKTAFTNPDALEAHLRSLTQSYLSNNLSNGQVVKPSELDSDNSLKHDYTHKEDDPLRLVTKDNKGTGNDGSVYRFHTGYNYDQQIAYKDKDGKQIGETNSIPVFVDEDGTLEQDEVDKVNAAIDQHMPEGYDYVSGKLAGPVAIDRTKNKALTVTVSKKAVQATLTINYVDVTHGNKVVKSETVNGTVDQSIVLNFALPDGYELDGTLPDSHYTFTAKDNTLIINVKKKTVPAKDATLTINYVDEATGETVKSNTVTGKVGDSIVLDFAVPDGYELDGTLPDSHYTFNAESNTLTINVKKIEAPDTPDNPVVPDNPDVPDTPDQPDTPDVPDTPDTPDTPDVPDTPVNPDKPDAPEAPAEPEKPVISNKQAALVKQHAGVKDQAVKKAEAAKLPQTGNDKQASGLLAAIGAILVAAFGFAFRRRNKKQ